MVGTRQAGLEITQNGVDPFELGPDEQQKRLRYNDLVASAMILQNTVDMMRTLRLLESEGWKIDSEDLSFLSPYLVGHLKRFGDYSLRLNRKPERWIQDEVFQHAVAAMRAQRRAAAT